jgi:pantothenate synthetase
VPGIVPEYFEIVDGKTLQSIENLDEHDHVVACTAVKVGEVRLIDNLEMKNL